MVDINLAGPVSVARRILVVEDDALIEVIDALIRQCETAAAGGGIALAGIEGELEADVCAVIFEAVVNDPQDEFNAPVVG